MEYAVRSFPNARGLGGIPDALVEAHLKLYAGYVNNVNLLRRRLAGMQPGGPEWAEMNRRLGFEINGMRLHELYFEALSPAAGDPARAVRGALARRWGSVEGWRSEFVEMGKMRGIGWVITYLDPRAEQLDNHWIELHQDGHPAGFVPIVVMDVWEHAYTGMERPAYIDAFLRNVDWSVIGGRLAGVAGGAA